MARTYSFTLTGETPLLMHADNIDFADELAAWRTDTKNKNKTVRGDDRSPAWTWIGGVYMSDTHVAMPSDNLATALRIAGTGVLMAKQKTFKAEAVSGMYILEDFMPFFVDGTKQIPNEAIEALRDEDDFAKHEAAAVRLGFTLFKKRAKIGKAKHVRVRARFDAGWVVRGTIEVQSPMITTDRLVQLFELAGRTGLGSWRPGGATPGRFGMFSSTVKETKNPAPVFGTFNTDLQEAPKGPKAPKPAKARAEAAG